ncbi:PREDICTED: transcription termination factor 3, mitochondrial [Nicrophorus vespilloides]|uniref:Transcription termination factor 3, mitochondrial n=1 Tax=Nicrophorus vespilloides TaxID=110193 RepID=A0ABM1ND41_NICVS|nr:PREDICTED: transcription termination factor 3, mitochondrial [Nicrophorus vespilloides]
MLRRELSSLCQNRPLGLTNLIQRFSDLIVQKQDDLIPFNGIAKIPHEQSSVLDKCDEDISHVAPYLKPTFNFAAYVNKSVTLQELLKVGVDLHRLEKKVTVPQYILGLDFEKDVKNHIIFLHELGLEIDIVGRLITKNPYIFQQSLENMQVRINYLSSKKFTNDMIIRIIGHNPYWLMFSTKDIDNRLGFFQNEFALTGNDIRQLAVQQPKLITYSFKHIKRNAFVLKEEMGFTDDERKEILLKKPNIFMKAQQNMLETFEYLHRDMQISTETISKIPEVLNCRPFRLKQRHMFVKKLGLDQFNPKEPGYISIGTLVSGNDLVFCDQVCKCPIEDYNIFLKSL